MTMNLPFDIAAPAAQAPPLDVRPPTFEDRAAIHDIVMRSEIFGATDAECVDQMFLETWARPAEDNYHWLSCWSGDQMIGFACYGTESLTHDTWDLFWICVLPEARGRGAGRALIAQVEARVREANGRVMVIYTSSTPRYAPARRLYESAGFICVAVVPDYYTDGDDLNIYWKKLR